MRNGFSRSSSISLKNIDREDDIELDIDSDEEDETDL